MKGFSLDASSTRLVVLGQNRRLQMSAKDKLKYLMGAKARRMWLLGIKDWHLYYTPEDAEEIEGWDEGEAEEVWKGIYREVANYASGLSPDTCPFCRYYSWIRGYHGCFDCGYRKRHLKCAEEGSDFRRIVYNSKGHPFSNDAFWRRIAFPNEWYRKIVERMGR